MFVTKPASSQGPEFCDPPPFPVSCYVREYLSYLKSLNFRVLRAACRVLPFRDRHNLCCDTDTGASVNCWLHCRGRDMSVSRVGSEFDCLFARCYEEVYRRERYVSACAAFRLQPLPELGLWLVFVRRPSRHMYFAEHCDYWALD